MTLRWMEGFEIRQAAVLQRETYGVSNGSHVGNTPGSFPGRKQGTSANIGGLDFSTFISPQLVGAVTNTWTVQWAFQKTSRTSYGAGNPLINFYDQANGLQMQFKIVDGTRAGTWAVEAFRGATSLGKTKDYAWGARGDTWVVFQATVVIRTGTNGSINLKTWDYYNNVTANELNLTLINTADQGSDGIDQVGWGMDGGSRFDDIIVMDDAGSINNAQTSTPLLVFGQLPIGDPGSTDWIPSSGVNHYDRVDSSSTSTTHDLTEVSSDTVTDHDQFSMQSVTQMSNAGTPPIIGTQIDIHGAMKNSGSRQVRVNIDDPAGGNADVATSLTFSDLVVTARTLILETNPVSTVAWTLVDLEDHYVGIKLHA